MLQGLGSPGADDERLDDALSHMRSEAEAAGVDFRVTVQGPSRPLHPIVREEAYHVGRQAVESALRQARASSVEVEIRYSARGMRLLVRDDGHGAGAIGASPAPGPELSTLRARAESIGARLRVRSGSGSGTEVELSVPAALAFTAGASGPIMSEP